MSSGSKNCLFPPRTSSFNICNDQVSSQTPPQTPDSTVLLRSSPMSLVLQLLYYLCASRLNSFHCFQKHKWTSKLDVVLLSWSRCSSLLRHDCFPTSNLIPPFSYSKTMHLLFSLQLCIESSCWSCYLHWLFSVSLRVTFFQDRSFHLIAVICPLGSQMYHLAFGCIKCSQTESQSFDQEIRLTL